MARLLMPLLPSTASHQPGPIPPEILALREKEVELLARDCQLLPEASSLHYRHGMMLYLVDRPEEALVALKEACRLEPGSYSHWIAVALLYEKLQQWDAASAVLDHIEQIRPGDPAIRGIRARMQQVRQQVAPPPDVSTKE